MVRLIINFENELSAERFMVWLENQGQENYWNYVSHREDIDGSESENSAVVNFDYDYEDFLIHTECGPVDPQNDLDDFNDFQDEEEV